MKRQRKGREREKYRRTYNCTTLSDVRIGDLPRTEGRGFASVGFQRYVWTSFSYRFDGFGIFRFFFSGFFLHFPPDPYGIRGFQLNVGWYNHFIFVIFVWILWDCRNFAVRMKTGCVGRFLMQTLFYRLTSKRKHLSLPKNAVKENVLSSRLWLPYFFHFFMFLSFRLLSSQTENFNRHLRKSERKKTSISDFRSSFLFRFEISQSTCDTLIRNINFHFLHTPCKSLFYRGSRPCIKYLRHSNT